MSRRGRDLNFLQDIEDAIKRIQNYTAGLTWDEYREDEKTQDAVVRNLEVIGEATKNLSDEFRRQHTEVPWRDMTGTRDRLTHHYFGINQEIVWQIVVQDLQRLRHQIEHIINDISGGNA